jgi:membrane-anchored mycosin MYCP
MGATGWVKGRVESYQGDELVVALPHLRLVRSELERLGARPIEQDEDAGLGLALLTLPHDELPKAVAELARRPRVKAEMERARASRIERAPRLADDYPALDDLLVGLRTLFAEENGGWQPTLGKNRIIALSGAPYISGGGEGAPKRAAKLTLRDSLRPGRGVRIGVIDTKLCEHPWLDDSYDAAPGGLLPLDQARKGGKLASAVIGHATFVSGMILQRAPGATLEISPVLDDRAQGTVWKAAQRIVQFAGSGVDILNCSFVCFTDDDDAPLVLATAIDRLGPEVVVVAAAGNHGDPNAKSEELPDLEPNKPSWPAALDEVVAVGAEDAKGERANFSPDAKWVDRYELGVDVRSTYVTGEVLGERLRPEPGPNGELTEKVELKFAEPYATWDGTSFAAATFSGRIAAGIQPGRLEAREVVRQLLDSP